MGEGWHNYHHVFPWDYRAAELGTYSLNITTFWLDQFAKIGWAYDLKKPSDRMIRAHAAKYSGHEHPTEVDEKEALAVDCEEDKMNAFDYIKNKPDVNVNGDVKAEAGDKENDLDSTDESKTEYVKHSKDSLNEKLNGIHATINNNNNTVDQTKFDSIIKNKSVEKTNGFDSFVQNKKTDLLMNGLNSIVKSKPEPINAFDSIMRNGGILIKDKAA